MRLATLFLHCLSIRTTSHFSARLLVLSTFLMIVPNLNAAELEVTPFLGYNFSPDLASGDSLNDTSVNSGANFSLALAWQEETQKQRASQGQGQVLINYSNRDFVSNTDQQTHDFDILYTHFNGVTFMREEGYVTTIGLGFGATYFDSENDSAIYPSLTSSIGTRHALSDNLTFVTEIRVYATLVEDDSKLFCQDGACFAQFNSSIWFDSNVSVGLAYSF